MKKFEKPNRSVVSDTANYKRKKNSVQKCEGRFSLFDGRMPIWKRALFPLQVLSSHTINATTLYQYTVGNESEIAKLLKNKDGGKNAMRLASTLLSVMSESSEEELKTEDKMKVKNVGFLQRAIIHLSYNLPLFLTAWCTLGGQIW